MSYLKRDDPLLIIIGPSGSGKSSAIQELARQNIIDITPSWTTRPPRGNEMDTAIEHLFVSDMKFEQEQNKGNFLEVVELFGLPYRYALPRFSKPKPGHVPLIMLRVNLLSFVPKHYSNYRVYQIRDEYERVEKRLKARAAEGEDQGSRLSDYKKEVELGDKSANRVFINNRGITELVNDIKAAIREDF